jgi:adenylate cyclase
MGDPDVRQRLAAILAADVAGYSRLMADDEAATIAALDAARAVFGTHVASERGRIVDTAGDSVLAIFDRAASALEAALAIQKALAAAALGEPEHRRMRFRIGLHLGDVHEKADGTIYGNGVNIAARLEALAEPGGICLSEAMRGVVAGQVTAEFDDIGRQTVKNIAEPIHAFRVRLSATDLSLPAQLPDKPAIAVLAFDNLSNDPEQAYFADGISEDIITDLSKVSGLFVTSRNSSFSYKGQAVGSEKVCRELGVAYLLEGSVRKAGGRVRITAQLIDGRTGGHLWAERYDRRLDDIFDVQDEVTREIVAALKVKLTLQDEANLAHRGTNNLDAYEAFLRGREGVMSWTRAGHEEGQPWLEKALAFDSSFAAPMAHLALIPMVAYFNRWGEAWQAGLDGAHELALKAVALDERSPYAHWALGTVLLWQGELEAAIAAQQQVIALEPNFAGARTVTAMALHYLGHSESALPHLDEALRLDPIGDDYMLHQLGLCHFMLGDYDAAETALRKRIVRSPTTDASRVALVATYGLQGRIDEARAVWAEIVAMSPEYSFADKRAILPYRHAGDAERIAEGLRKAGVEA